MVLSYLILFIIIRQLYYVEDVGQGPLLIYVTHAFYVIEDFGRLVCGSNCPHEEITANEYLMALLMIS